MFVLVSEEFVKFSKGVTEFGRLWIWKRECLFLSILSVGAIKLWTDHLLATVQNILASKTT